MMMTMSTNLLARKSANLILEKDCEVDFSSADNSIKEAMLNRVWDFFLC